MRDDLKTAFRSLRTSRSFTVVALVVLALGTGAGTAVFSIVDAVVLRALPFDEHDRIVAVLSVNTTAPTTFGGGSTTTQTYLDWRKLQQSFDGVALVGPAGFRVKTASDEPADARAERVTWEFFPVLRVAPTIGRAFTADDEIDGRSHSVILSYGFWQQRFGGAPDVVGKTLELDEEPWIIVGVMPREFSYPVANDKPTELYVPQAFSKADVERGGSHNYNSLVIARLKPGVTIAQASGQMTRVAAALEEQYPTWEPGWRPRVVTLHERLVGDVRSWMLMLLGAVGLVLLLACANVANLLLVRATVRSREMGIRAALGASRWRLVRGLLVEGVLLSTTGAAIGLVLAFASVRVLRLWLPADLPRVASIGIDPRVLAVSVATALMTGIFFGIVPALQSSRPDLTPVLKEGGRAATPGASGQRLRSAFVVAEVGLAVVLLVGAGLFIASFLKLVSVDPGFEYHHVLALNVGVRIQGNNFEDALKRGGPYVQQMLDSVSHVPGVDVAGAVSGGLPLSGGWSRAPVTLPGGQQLRGDDNSIEERRVSPDYLNVLRVPLLRGRMLTPQDREGGEPVLVINDAAARKYWPGADPIGQHITINRVDRTVVGIVGNLRHLGPEVPPRQECYLPLAQSGTIGATIVMRTGGNPMQVLPAVKAAIWSVNREQHLSGMTLEGYMDRLIAQRRFNMALLTLFGILGLVIAAVGIYSVMAYVVAQRRYEIGVRMALGATPGRVQSMILSRAAVLMTSGLVFGGAGAWYLSVGVKTFLFAVQPNDLRVFGAALAVLTASGFLASVVPAYRASRIDPALALRAD